MSPGSAVRSQGLFGLLFVTSKTQNFCVAALNCSFLSCWIIVFNKTRKATKKFLGRVVEKKPCGSPQIRRCALKLLANELQLTFVTRLFFPLNADQRKTLIITSLHSVSGASLRWRLIPPLSAESNLKVANENMNIIKATLKNIIDLYAVVWVDIEPTF